MKKIFSIVLALLLVSSVAFARDAGFPSRGDLFLQTASITNDTDNNVGHTHIATSPSLVYRITITSSQANTYVHLIDSASTGDANTTALHISKKAAPTAGGNKKVKADVGAATANQSYVYDYNPPIKFEEGILAGLTEPTVGDGLGATTFATAVIEYTSAE